MEGLRSFDGIDRLARAGEYWRVAINDDDRFAFGADHSRTKYVVVQRDVLVHEHMVPSWVCTLCETDDWYIEVGLNARAAVERDGDEDVDVSIDLTKPISLPADWFREGSGRAERKGSIAPEDAVRCLAQQAIVMRAVSLDLRDH